MRRYLRMGVGRGWRAEKLPQREKANMYNRTNYATSRLRDDRNGTWGQGWLAVGPTQTWAHTALALLNVTAVAKEMRGSVEAFPDPGQQQL